MGTANFPTNICRLCVQEKNSSLLSGQKDFNAAIYYVLNIQIEENDGLPTAVCSDCENIIKPFYTYKLSCEKNQEKLCSLFSNMPNIPTETTVLSTCDIKTEYEEPLMSNEDMTDNVFVEPSTSTTLQQLPVAHINTHSNTVEFRSTCIQDSSSPRDIDDIFREFLDPSKPFHKHLVKRNMNAENWAHIINVLRDRDNSEESLRGLESELHQYLLSSSPYVEAMSQYPCDYCGMFSDAAKYCQHWAMHFMEQRCDKCQLHFASKEKLLNHQQIVCNSDMRCVVCLRNCASQYYARILNSDAVNNPYASILPPYCDHCFPQLQIHPTYLLIGFLTDTLKLSRHLVKRNLPKAIVKRIGTLIYEAGSSHRNNKFEELDEYMYSDKYVEGYKCLICDTLLQVNEYEEHMSMEHEIISEYPCDFCGKRIRKEEYMHHWVAHFMQFSCPRCPIRFPKQKQFDRHQQKSSCKKNKHPCQICGKEYATTDKCKDHMDSMHFKGTCYKCGKLFLTEMDGLDHPYADLLAAQCEKCLPVTKMQPLYLLAVFLIDASRPSKHLVKRNLSKAIVIKMNALICKSTTRSKNKDFGELSEYIFNEKYVEGYKCLQCDCMVNVNEYEGHMSIKHGGLSEYPCDYCGDCVPKKDYILHWIEHFMHFSCNRCPRKFPTYLQYGDHRRRSPNCAEKTCQYCKKKFPSSIIYRSHMEKVHLITLLDRDPCHICGKLVEKREMKRHVRRHERRRTAGIWVCNICNKACYMKSQLQEHMQTTHNEDGSTHSGNDESKNLCDECGRSFSTKQSLHVHIKIHKNIRDIKCTECDMAFASHSSLTNHMNSRHSTELKYTCEVCGKAFKTRSTYKQHMRLVHIQSEAYKCPLCNREVLSRGNFRTHMKVHLKRGEIITDELDKYKFVKDNTS